MEKDLGRWKCCRKGGGGSGAAVQQRSIYYKSLNYNVHFIHRDFLYVNLILSVSTISSSSL